MVEKAQSLIEQLEQRRRAMKVTEVAELLAVSPWTIYRMAEKSELPYLRVRGSLRFDGHDIAEWLKTQKPVRKDH